MIRNSFGERGALLVVILVFGAALFTMLVGYTNYAVNQFRLQQYQVDREQAREIAEAGINYYKWYLAHNPDDVMHGTGVPGPYVIPYEDPELGAIGEFSLDITSTEYCGSISSIEITSVGSTYSNPSNQRTVYARYARPTVAEYAYIINSNVWAGSDRTIIGPYHSNGGVRMDGTNNSTVTSGQSTWNCTSTFGCIPSQSNADGVIGSGPNDDLWTFPSTPINFTGLTVDLVAMKDRAENQGGVYIPPSSGYGYRMIFEADGDIEVREVDDTYSYDAYNSADGWHTERNIIDDDSFYASYTLDPNCPLIFVEDNVWLEGEVPMRVSLAAADVASASVDPTLVLNDNLTYTSSSSGLLAIAEEDVLIGVDVPEDMTVEGIFVAQNGRFGRNHYERSGLPQTCARMGWSFWYGWSCIEWFEPFRYDVFKDSLTINGTIVSNGRVGTQWVNGGVQTSGFSNRYNTYDRELVANPPPLAPNTSDDYQFIEWREE